MRRSWRFLVILLAASSCLPFARQISSPVPQTGAGERVKTYTLSGTVTNAVTGEPIRRALVHVNGQVQLSAFTGSDGRFQVSGIPQGQAFVTAEKPGFFDEQSLQSGPYTAQNTALTVGPGTNEFPIKLAPEAKIRGRVLDSDGEPIEGLQLEVLAREISEGHRQVQMRMMAGTDDAGVYLVEGLTPGQYFIRTLVYPVFSSFFGSPRTAYPPQYYSNSPDLASAQSLDLKPGQEAEADFTLHPTAISTISGVAAGTQNGLFVSYEGSDHQQIPAGSLQFDQATGKFVLGMVPSGAWSLRFNSNDAQGNVYYAEQDVEVNGSDISGLRVLLQPAPAIPVVVNRASPVSSGSQNDPSQPPDQNRGVQVQLVAENNAQNERFYAAPKPGDSQGALFIQGARPGSYKVVAQAIGSDCIQSVSAGNTDLMRNDLLISPGSQPPPITVSLRSDCATIAGTLHSETPNASAFLLVVPDAAPTAPTLYPVPANQNFAFSSLSPGTYRVWAFSNVAGLEYANPDALHEYPNQQVSLEPNQKLTVNLQLVERGGN